MDAEIQWMFLFGPRVMPGSGTARRDWGQKSLQTSFGIPLAPQTRYKMKAVVIGDSSISSVSVKYGLSMVLRDAGIYLCWLLAKSCACARDLADIRDSAPPCDLGLTITNCNDIFQDFSMPPHLSENVKNLVESAHRKTQVHAVFFVSDAGFFSEVEARCLSWFGAANARPF